MSMSCIQTSRSAVKVWMRSRLAKFSTSFSVRRRSVLQFQPPMSARSTPVNNGGRRRGGSLSSTQHLRFCHSLRFLAHPRVRNRGLHFRRPTRPASGSPGRAKGLWRLFPRKPLPPHAPWTIELRVYLSVNRPSRFGSESRGRHVRGRGDTGTGYSPPDNHDGATRKAQTLNDQEEDNAMPRRRPAGAALVARP